MVLHPISQDLACRTCGYQLRGLSALGRCPECGAEAMASIATAVDPALRAFVRLASPARTASSLLLVVSLMSLAVLVQLVAPVVAVIQEVTDRPGPQAAQLMPLGWWIAAALLTLASIASLAIAPLSEPLLRAEWGRRRIALSAGLLLWAIAIVALPFAFGWRPGGSYPSSFVLIITTAWQLLSALAPLSGLREIVTRLGRRCQRWRHARQGRQSVDALLAAGAGVLVFSTAVPIMASYRFDSLETMALLLAGSSAAILALGLAYLVVNAWWIARALVRPPALLGEMVEGAER